MERIDSSHQQPLRRRILIVVARRLVAEGLEALFSQQPDWQVLLVGNVEEALLSIEQWRPEVAVVDLTFPDGKAFLLFQQIRCRWPKIRVVFLDDSVHQGRWVAVQSLRSAGYFTLADSFGVLSAGLRRILEGCIVSTPAVESFSFPKRTGAAPHLPRQSLSSSGKTDACEVEHSPLSRLSRREMEVLIHLARGLTVKECAEQMHLSPNTVDNHKARLMNKLGLHRSGDLIRLAIREKLIEQ